MRTLIQTLAAILWVGAGLVHAQAAIDPFADFYRNILDVAQREAAAVREGHPEPDVARTVDTVPTLSQLDAGLERLQELKPLISGIFDQHGVPQEFLLVALVESGYRTNAISPANAVGMWQFMESTARRFGLIDRAGDHRTELIRSTHAAAAYLKFLLNRYNDWRLALAAYNAGEERVDRAIAAAGSAEFSTIARRTLLPQETLSYVPAVLKRMAEARNAGLIQLSGNYE